MKENYEFRFYIVFNWFGIIIRIEKSTRLEVKESYYRMGNRMCYSVNSDNEENAIRKYRKFYLENIEKLNI